MTPLHPIQLEALGTFFNLVEPSIYDPEGVLFGFDDTKRPVVLDRYALSGHSMAISVDILPALKGEDSAKRSSRLHVSSVVKYAFASHVGGCRPIITEGVLYSAFSPVKGAFRLGRAGRFVGTNTTRSSTAGYSARTVPPFASDPWAGTWRSGSSDLLPRGTWTQSVCTSEAGVSRRGNSGRLLYGCEWYERVGFIPALKREAFSSHLRKTGSGKSYFRKLEIYRRLLADPNVQCILFDPAGDDYPRFAQSLGGEVIRFGGNYTVNPMDISPPADAEQENGDDTTR